MRTLRVNTMIVTLQTPAEHQAAQALVETLKDLMLVLEDRYDGAPDSGTRWMGEHLYEMKRVLGNAGYYKFTY